MVEKVLERIVFEKFEELMADAAPDKVAMFFDKAFGSASVVERDGASLASGAHGSFSIDEARTKILRYVRECDAPEYATIIDEAFGTRSEMICSSDGRDHDYFFMVATSRYGGAFGSLPFVEESSEIFGNVMDLDRIMWDSIKKAASEAPWMPSEYSMNDWVSDVCDFLREGPQALNACRELYAAYERGEAAGGSVDWEDVNIAYELAAEALPPSVKARVEKEVAQEMGVTVSPS